MRHYCRFCFGACASSYRWCLAQRNTVRPSVGRPVGQAVAIAAIKLNCGAERMLRFMVMMVHLQQISSSQGYSSTACLPTSLSRVLPACLRPLTAAGFISKISISRLVHSFCICAALCVRSGMSSCWYNGRTAAGPSKGWWTRKTA